MTWTPTRLPTHLEHRGGTPDTVAEELLAIITDAIVNHPRSLQRRIGPSEIGHPCARRIAYKLLDAPEFNHRVNWKAFIGTAMHEKLERVLDAYNTRWDATHGHIGQERFYVEQKVTAGQITGEDIDGSTDVYDRVTATVVDWKLVGDTQLTKYRRHGPGPQYRTQGHAYGAGWVARGLPVDHVMVVFLPRNKDIKHTVIWHEPFDPQVAADGFTRVNAIADTTRALGVQALPLLPTADAFCTFCDYYKPGSMDLTQGCPGDPAAQALGGQPPITFAGAPT